LALSTSGSAIQGIIARSFSPTSSIGCSAGAAHGLEAGLAGLVLQHPVAGEAAGLDVVEHALHLGALGLVGDDARAR
jgi:hypothetical protein